MNNDEVTAEVHRLHTDLLMRNDDSRLLDNYYRGDHPMPWAHRKVRKDYRELLRESITNFPQLVIDSLNDRLTVTGFRLDDTAADEAVWDIWQRNNLDVYAPMVTGQALVTGYSYGSVTNAGNGVSVKGESSFEVFHESEPGDPLLVRRAVKVWPNHFDKKWYAWFFADGQWWRLEADLREAQPSGTDNAKRSRNRWAKPAQWEVLDSGEGECPFVPFINRPDLDGFGIGEFADVVPLIDRINTLTSQLMLAGEFTAFRIKWATGIDIPSDDEGNPLMPFDVAMDRLWTSENPDAKFGTMEATDLKVYRDAIEQAVQQLAAITRTPPFMLLGNLTNLSAEALKATESGLVKKALQRQVTFGESWERLMAMALRATGDGRDTSDMETIWRDPENVSESQHVDALTKLYTIGLPAEAVWEEWGASPQQIERFRRMRAEDALNRMMLSGGAQAPGLNATPGVSSVQGGQGSAALAQMPDSGPDE